MKFGFCLPTFASLGTRAAILRAAELAEQDGWDSVWVTDHVLMASSQPFPYGHIYEAIATLAFVGGMTQRVKLGTSIVVLPQRNPIVVAKEIATLDALSDGRVILGVAAGWNEFEFNYLGANFHRRGKMLEEGISILRALWTEERPTFEGKFYKFNDTLFSPKPKQAHIPLWIGGNSDAAAKRAARLGDGWHITGSAPERAGQTIQTLRPMLNGRAFTFSARVETDPTGKLPTEFAGPDGSPRRRLRLGAEEAAQDIEAYRRIGVNYLVIAFMGDSEEKMAEHAKLLAKEVFPKFK